MTQPSLSPLHQALALASQVAKTHASGHVMKETPASRLAWQYLRGQIPVPKQNSTPKEDVRELANELNRILEGSAIPPSLKTIFDKTSTYSLACAVYPTSHQIVAALQDALRPKPPIRLYLQMPRLK